MSNPTKINISQKDLCWCHSHLSVCSFFIPLRRRLILDSMCRVPTAMWVSKTDLYIFPFSYILKWYGLSAQQEETIWIMLSPTDEGQNGKSFIIFVLWYIIIYLLNKCSFENTISTTTEPSVSRFMLQLTFLLMAFSNRFGRSETHQLTLLLFCAMNDMAAAYFDWKPCKSNLIDLRTCWYASEGCHPGCHPRVPCLIEWTNSVTMLASINDACKGRMGQIDRIALSCWLRYAKKKKHTSTRHTSHQIRETRVLTHATGQICLSTKFHHPQTPF